MMCPVCLNTCFWLNFNGIFSVCTELGSVEPSLPDLIDLPPKMTNFVPLGSAEPGMLL